MVLICIFGAYQSQIAFHVSIIILIVFVLLWIIELIFHAATPSEHILLCDVKTHEIFQFKKSYCYGMGRKKICISSMNDCYDSNSGESFLDYTFENKMEHVRGTQSQSDQQAAEWCTVWIYHDKWFSFRVGLLQEIDRRQKSHEFIAMTQFIQDFRKWYFEFYIKNKEEWQRDERDLLVPVTAPLGYVD